MEELTPALPLRDEIRLALNGAANLERTPLAWIENHERAGWEVCDALAQANGLNRGAHASVVCQRRDVGRDGDPVYRLRRTRIATVRLFWRQIFIG